MTGKKGEGRALRPPLCRVLPTKRSIPNHPVARFPNRPVARFPIQAGAFLPTLTVHPTHLVLRDSPINLVRFFHLGVHSYPLCRGDLGRIRVQARPLLSPFEYFP